MAQCCYLGKFCLISLASHIRPVWQASLPLSGFLILSRRNAVFGHFFPFIPFIFRILNGKSTLFMLSSTQILSSPLTLLQWKKITTFWKKILWNLFAGKCIFFPVHMNQFRQSILWIIFIKHDLFSGFGFSRTYPYVSICKTSNGLIINRNLVSGAFSFLF